MAVQLFPLKDAMFAVYYIIKREKETNYTIIIIIQTFSHQNGQAINY